MSVYHVVYLDKSRILPALSETVKIMQRKRLGLYIRSLHGVQSTRCHVQTLVIRMLNDLSENLTKEIGNIKMETENIIKNQSEMKYTITEIKNTLEGINSILDEVENQISNLEDKVAENSQNSNNKKDSPQNENSLRGLWNNIKCTNFHTIGAPEEEEREQGI